MHFEAFTFIVEFCVSLCFSLEWVSWCWFLCVCCLNGSSTLCPHTSHQLWSVISNKQIYGALSFCRLSPSFPLLLLLYDCRSCSRSWSFWRCKRSTSKMNRKTWRKSSSMPRRRWRGYRAFLLSLASSWKLLTRTQPLLAPPQVLLEEKKMPKCKR